MRATLALNGLRKPSEKLDLSLKSPRKNWKKKLMKKNLDFIFYNPQNFIKTFAQGIILQINYNMNKKV